MKLTISIRKLLMTLSEIVVITSSVERSFHDSVINTASNTQLDVYIYGEIFRSATAVQTYNGLFYNFALKIHNVRLFK
ncbi:hypothetical protein P4S68_10950 [Pseudoalteromonas sp. Hal099]